jgi:hypothetical protein
MHETKDRLNSAIQNYFPLFSVYFCLSFPHFSVLFTLNVSL